MPASTSTFHQVLIRRIVAPIKGQQRVECRKICGKGAKRTQILGMSCSTLRLPLRQGSPACPVNGGMCVLISRTRSVVLSPVGLGVAKAEILAK